MKRSITIEIDERSPDIELCGKNCKFLGKEGYLCKLFDKDLEDYGHNKVKNHDGTIVYENTIAIDSWRRDKKCIEVFSCFNDKQQFGA